VEAKHPAVVEGRPVNEVGGATGYSLLIRELPARNRTYGQRSAAVRAARPETFLRNAVNRALTRRLEPHPRL